MAIKDFLTVSTNTAANFTQIPRPTVHAGDLLFVWAANTVVASCDPPIGSGWTRLSPTIGIQSSTSSSGTEGNLFVMEYTSAHALLSNPDWITQQGTFTYNTNMRHSTIIFSTDDINIADIIDISATFTSALTPSLYYLTQAVPSINTANDGNFVVILVSAHESVNATNHTLHLQDPNNTANPHPDYTEIFDTNQSAATSRIAAGMWTRTQALAGGTGSLTVECSNISSWAGIIMSLNVDGATAGNVPPTIDVGADVTNHSVNTLFTRVASASDSDGTIISYEWIVTSGPSQVGTVIGTTGTLQWTPDALGNYTLSCTVTDDDNATTTDTMVIQVIQPPEGSGMYKFNSLTSTWNQIEGPSVRAAGAWVQ